MIYPFLEKSIDLDGRNLRLNADPNHDPSVTFWSREYPRVEPDLEIRFQSNDGREVIILVEVKYFSGLSGDDVVHFQPGTTEQSSHQLVRQIQALSDNHPEAVKYQIFLTMDSSFPRDVMEYTSSCVSDSTMSSVGLYWLSWHDLPRVLDQAMVREIDHFRRIILGDLMALCRDRKGFRRFEGLRIPTNSVSPLQSRRSFYLHPTLKPSVGFKRQFVVSNLPFPVKRGAGIPHPTTIGEHHV